MEINRKSKSLFNTYVFSRVGLCVTPWTVARQAPLSMGFSRQEYWSGLLCPPPEDLPDPGIKSVSLTSPALAGGFFTARATWEVQSLQHTLTFLSILHPLTLYILTEKCIGCLKNDFFLPKVFTFDDLLQLFRT